MTLPGHYDATLARMWQSGCQAVPQVVDDIQLMQLRKFGLVQSCSIEWQTPIITMLERRVHLAFVDVRKAYGREEFYFCVCYTSRR